MRAVRVLMSVLAAFGLLLAVAPRATAADDYLVASDPRPHQQTEQVPGWVTLAFQTTANAKLAKILVLDKDGKNVTVGALIVEETNVTTQLISGLPKGTYTVYYRTSGKDGQKRGGAFQFSYGPGTWTPVDKDVWVGDSEEPPVLKNPDPNATGPATATPSISPSATAEPSSASPSGAASTPPGSPPQTPADGDSLLPWIIGAGALVVAVAGGSGVYAWRRRRG